MRAPKKCGRSDCEERVAGGIRYCPAHTAEKQRRPPRQQRGYDAEYDRTRQRWAPMVASGMVVCWRCGKPIMPHEEWQLGHDGPVIMGPEHARTCNLRAAGLKAHGKQWVPGWSP